MASARAVHFIGNTKWRLPDVSQTNPLHRHFHALREAAGVPLLLTG